MRVTICELPDDAAALEAAWPRLVDHAREHRSELVLLPELPFAPWLPLQSSVDEQAWADAVGAHARAIAEWLPQLAPAAVAATRPVDRDGARRNEAFLWTLERGVEPVHLKRYLPEEPAFYERTWFERGPDEWSSAQAGEARAGFLVCSELWFPEHARGYGQQGAHLVLTPRCTEAATLDRWLTAGRTVAMIAGAYSVSSNRTGVVAGAELGGRGWIADPDGEVLATTDAGRPFATLELPLEAAELAKGGYPRTLDRR